VEATRSNPWTLAGGLTALCIFVLFGGLFFVLFASRPEPVGAVTALASYAAEDKAFHCVYPEGWKKDGGGRANEISWAEFSKGDASIYINANLQGSLMGDIMKAPGGGVPDMSGVPGAGGEIAEASADVRKPPVERLHESGAAKAKKRHPKYEEMSMEAFQSPMGDARFSEFTAQGPLFTGRIHGYRVTILGGERLVEVTLRCAERDWPMLKPHFTKVVNSIAPGGA
jgi:hypothetical protein